MGATQQMVWGTRPAKMICPLLHREIPCPGTGGGAWCGYCAWRTASAAPLTIAVPVSTSETLPVLAPEVTGKPQRTCIDCGGMPAGPRQQRCGDCATEHARKKNANYQAEHRRRQRESGQTEMKPRTLSDFTLSQIEQLHADGLSPSAAAERLGISHHSALRHLSRPEVEQRVAFLRRWNVPEQELPH